MKQSDLRILEIFWERVRTLRNKNMQSIHHIYIYIYIYNQKNKEKKKGLKQVEPGAVEKNRAFGVSLVNGLMKPNK